MNNLFCIEQARNRMPRKPVAGAGERLRDRYQSGRIVEQFLLRPEPKAIAAREGLKPSQVLKVVRDRLAMKEAA